MLEIAAWSQANAVRQVTVKRGLDVRDYHAGRVRRLGPAAGRAGWSTCSASAAALVPPDPGNVSAFGLLTVDVKNDYVRTAVQRDDQLDLARSARHTPTSRRRLVTRSPREGFARRR